MKELGTWKGKQGRKEVRKNEEHPNFPKTKAKP
jgi:hypothetical protein